MSSILKALKKLEEQKAPRPQYELDLSSGIMRERKAGRHRRWVIPAGMAAVAIAAALTTYAVMALHPKTDIKARQSEVASTTASPIPPQPAATLPPPAGVPVTTPRKVDAARPTVAGGATAATPVESKPALRPARQQPKNQSPPRPMPSAAIAEIPSAPPAASFSPPARSDRIPDLKLSGIAWQKDSASRYAVVNGMAVSEGSTIEGVKIDEILPDKVRFSMGSRSFEVPMGHISPTN